MPYDSSTGLHSSPLPSVSLPDEPKSVYDFLFPEGQTPDDTRPWLIDATSDLQYTRKQAHDRILDLAKAFHSRGIRDKSCAVIFSPNDVNYGPCLWANFRQGGIVSPANPSYNASELAYQLKIGKPTKRGFLRIGSSSQGGDNLSLTLSRLLD